MQWYQRPVSSDRVCVHYRLRTKMAAFSEDLNKLHSYRPHLGSVPPLTKILDPPLDLKL